MFVLMVTVTVAVAALLATGDVAYTAVSDVAVKAMVWYFADACLLLALGFCAARLLLFLACWVCGYEFWVLPKYCCIA